MPIPSYTGSPLGLITSVNEFQYKSNGGGVESIFSSYQDKKNRHLLKSNQGYNNAAVLSGTPHSNQIYDISTSNIIGKLSEIEHLQLNFADFAYLKDFGVYPNNRLMIARRFAQPVIDDLYSTPSEKVGKPMSTVIGYHGESEDFIKLNFNEEWGNAEVSFVNLLNSLGEDFGLKGQFQLGNILQGAVNVVPLPGATLLLQRKIMKAMGVIDNEDSAVIPQGDPNLIKEARSRTLIGEDEQGSGLSCKVSIDLKTKYEQKFINGVDPTIVFMDILNNVLNMGTSIATFYLGKQTDAEDRMKRYLEDFMANPGQKIKEFLEAIIEAFKSQLKRLNDNVNKAIKSTNPSNGPASSTAILDDVTKLIGISVGEVKGYVSDYIRAKYKIRFIGIINALTGGPSTPWHITIGNPMRPIFCSGDMLCKGVDVNFGPQLSFNDLPTYIEVTVKLESARNIGLQEIFSKFNTGGIRTVVGTASGEYLPGIRDDFWSYQALTATSSTNSNPGQESNSTDSTEKRDNRISSTQSNITTVTEVSGTQSITSSQDNNLSIVSDPYSSDPIGLAGINSNSDTLRVDNAQDMTGATDGYSDQLSHFDDVPYEGANATESPNDLKETESINAISESVEISSTAPPIYSCIGLYDVNGKTMTGVGSGKSDQESRQKAKENAKNKSK